MSSQQRAHCIGHFVTTQWNREDYTRKGEREDALGQKSQEKELRKKPNEGRGTR